VGRAIALLTAGPLERPHATTRPTSRAPRHQLLRSPPRLNRRRQPSRDGPWRDDRRIPWRGRPLHSRSPAAAANDLCCQNSRSASRRVPRDESAVLVEDAAAHSGRSAACFEDHDFACLILHPELGPAAHSTPGASSPSGGRTASPPSSPFSASVIVAGSKSTPAARVPRTRRSTARHWHSIPYGRRAWSGNENGPPPTCHAGCLRPHLGATRALGRPASPQSGDSSATVPRTNPDVYVGAKLNPMASSRKRPALLRETNPRRAATQ